MVTIINGVRTGKMHNSGTHQNKGMPDGPTRTMRRRSTKSSDRNRKRAKR